MAIITTKTDFPIETSAQWKLFQTTLTPLRTVPFTQELGGVLASIPPGQDLFVLQGVNESGTFYVVCSELHEPREGEDAGVSIVGMYADETYKGELPTVARLLDEGWKRLNANHKWETAVQAMMAGILSCVLVILLIAGFPDYSEALWLYLREHIWVFDLLILAPALVTVPCVWLYMRRRFRREFGDGALLPA